MITTNHPYADISWNGKINDGHTTVNNTKEYPEFYEAWYKSTEITEIWI